jgi:hypothetical protein
MKVDIALLADSIVSPTVQIALFVVAFTSFCGALVIWTRGSNLWKRSTRTRKLFYNSTIPMAKGADEKGKYVDHIEPARMVLTGNPLVMTLQRAEKSMTKLYATYAVLHGLLVTICLASISAENFRVAWIIWNTVLIVYVCLVNRITRPRILRMAERLTVIES